jgi:hypothetical protein
MLIEDILAKFKVPHQHLTEELRKQKNSFATSPFLEQDLKARPPEYEAGVWAS